MDVRCWSEDQNKFLAEHLSDLVSPGFAHASHAQQPGVTSCVGVCCCATKAQHDRIGRGSEFPPESNPPETWSSHSPHCRLDAAKVAALLQASKCAGTWPVWDLISLSSLYLSVSLDMYI